MVSKTRLVFIGLSAIFLAGCASIHSGPDNTLSLTTTSSNQAYAEHDAKTKAEDYCLVRGKSFVLLDHLTKYNGAGRSNAYEVSTRFSCK